MTILILDNLDSFTFNLVHQVKTHQLGQQQTQPFLDDEGSVVVKRNYEVSLDDIKAMSPSHIIISPGPGHPKNDSDFGVCRDVIVADLGIPVLGVCLGFQGMVHYWGGDIVHAPEVVHGKTSDITLTQESVLFCGFSQHITVMRYHSLMANPKTFPDCFTVTAYTVDEAGNQIIMAAEHKTMPLYGVQFHPESIGTPEGNQLMANFLNL